MERVSGEVNGKDGWKLLIYVTQDQMSKWPDEAILAVVDLVYQWGAKGIFDNAKGLNKDLAKAILAQDWEAAASNVPSADGGARAKDRKELFKKAAVSKAGIGK
jgi:hypothetical protein